MTRVPMTIRNQFSFCYEANEAELNRFNIQGYYRVLHVKKKFSKNFELEYDTTFANLLFFNDGTFASEFYNNIDDMEHLFNEISKHGKNSDFFRTGYWGVYIIDGDTLKTQSINHPSALSSTWHAVERWYKIVDMETIRIIGAKKLGTSTGETKTTMSFNRRADEIFWEAKFIPQEILPSSDSWLKDEKWFWCNEENYKAWKKSQSK